MAGTGKVGFHAGALLYRPIRKAVERARFEGYSVEIWEGSGWISRDFIIKGDAEAVMAIVEWLKDVTGKSSNGQLDSSRTRA